MQLSKELREWVEADYGDEVEKLNKKMDVDIAGFQLRIFNNKNNNSQVYRQNFLMLRIELNNYFANKSNPLFIKKTEIYITAFEKDKKVLNDSDIAEILDDIKNVCEERARFNKSKIEDINKISNEKLIDDFELTRGNDKNKILEEAKRKLIKAKTEMVIAQREQENSSNSNKNEIEKYEEVKISSIELSPNKKSVNNLEKELVQGGICLKKISWLHLTDLHRGMSEQKPFWSTISTEFYHDLKRMIEKVGKLDLVLFTGDLVQYGREEEFNMLEETLLELWKEFNALDCNPLLLTVPGNHDLVRPNSKSASVVAFDLWKTHNISEELWENSESDYRKTVVQAFANYEKWLETTSLPLASKNSKCEYQRGLLPGDFSASLEINNIRVGIVGINSAFLQLKGGDYEKRLDVDVRQVQAACSGNLHKWVKKNDIKILMTHHPSSWLCPTGLDHFKENILSRDNFTFHVYGHMHEGSSTETRIAGGIVQREIQGSSLFSSESWGEDNKKQRIHGYNMVDINISGNNGEARIWPRLLVKTRAGYNKLIADYNFDLEEESYFNTTFSVKGNIEVKTEENLKREKEVSKDNSGENIQKPLIANSNRQESKNSISIEIRGVQLKVNKSLKKANGIRVVPTEDCYRWSLIVAFYIEAFTSEIIVVPKHRSTIWFEVPNVVERLDFKKWYFSKSDRDTLVNAISDNELQIKGSGTALVRGEVEMPLTEKITIDNRGKAVLNNGESEIKACISVSLYLSGKGETVTDTIKVPYKNNWFSFEGV